MVEGIKQIDVVLEDLETFRTTLLAVLTYLEASDMSKCQLNMYAEARWSPLTQEVRNSITRIEGLIGDYLVESHFAESEIDPEVADEDVPELSDNPLGMSKGIKPAAKKVMSDAERVE